MSRKFWTVAVATLAIMLGGVMSYAQDSAASTTEKAWHGRHGNRMA